MPICITCSTPVRNLYTTYSKADDRSLGKGVRLTQCPKCKRFADKYVEHDYVVLFIDLVLIKPQVYRHLLFNRLGRTDDKLDPSILRLGILLVLFDVYITWARIERSNDPTSTSSEFAGAPIFIQYLFFLTLNIVATLAQHLTIRILVQWLTRLMSVDRQTHRGRHNHRSEIPNGTSESGHVSQRNSPVKAQAAGPSSHSPLLASHDDSSNSSPHNPPGKMFSADQLSGSVSSPTISSNSQQRTLGPGYASPAAISTALLVSSCTKLFPILLVIWPTSSSDPTDDAASGMLRSTASFAHRASNYIGWIVLLNNIEALHILLDCGYMVAGSVAVAGAVSRWMAEGWLLGMVGLMRDGGGYGDGPVSDVLRSWAWICQKAIGGS